MPSVSTHRSLVKVPCHLYPKMLPFPNPHLICMTVCAIRNYSRRCQQQLKPISFLPSHLAHVTIRIIPFVPLDVWHMCMDDDITKCSCPITTCWTVSMRFKDHYVLMENRQNIHAGNYRKIAMLHSTWTLFRISVTWSYTSESCSVMDWI